jgi:putative Mg2+ transporter-C (MgtC) family protein
MQFVESFNILVKYAPYFLFQTFVAALCGFLIGFEREKRRKPAGYRTIVLITCGSCIFTIISQHVPSITGMGNSDPTRIAAQIVTGIGFLGAGAIIQSKGTVVGLTTAAVIWVMSAIGMLIGFGYPLIGFVTTISILIFLLTSYKIEDILVGKCHYADLEITFNDSKLMKSTVSSILLDNDIDISKYKLISKDNDLILRIRYCDVHLSHHKFLADLYGLDGIKEIVSIDVDAV